MLQNLEKTLFNNLADDSYLSADWESREKVIKILREASKQIKRLIELSDLIERLGEENMKSLQGANAAVEFSCETLGNLEKPIEAVKNILQNKSDEIENIILDNKMVPERFNLYISYLNSFLRTLKRIIIVTEGLGE
jgi:hypothetical protein